MRVIGFVGRQASGKTTAANTLKEKGIPAIRMGDTVRKITKSRGLSLNEKNIGQVASELRSKEGMDAIAKRTIPRIRNCESDLVVIDGIRGKAEVDAFKDEFDENLLIVAVLSSRRKRFDRIKRRDRSDDVKSWEDFLGKESREDSWGMDEAIKEADLILENDSSLKEFQNKIEDKIINEFCVEEI